jgi:cytochrome c553
VSAQQQQAAGRALCRILRARGAGRLVAAHSPTQQFRSFLMRARVLLVILFAFAAPAMAAGDAGRGKQAYTACVACHGAEGAGNAGLHAPALAGQDAAYTERQLLNYRAGIRGGTGGDTYAQQMRGMSMSIGPAQAADIAAWLSSLPAPRPAGSLPGDLRNGNNLWQGKCGACHGSSGEGYPALNAPRLRGQEAGYLRRQFLAFRSGERGAHPDDTYGKQMALMAKTLDPGKELDDVLAWLRAQDGAAQ